MKIPGMTTFLAHPGVGKNLCFIKIDTDEGIHGWGSVTPSRTGTYRSWLMSINWSATWWAATLTTSSTSPRGI